jgi:hypothetical protein
VFDVAALGLLFAVYERVRHVECSGVLCYQIALLIVLCSFVSHCLIPFGYM